MEQVTSKKLRKEEDDEGGDRPSKKSKSKPRKEKRTLEEAAVDDDNTGVISDEKSQPSKKKRRRRDEAADEGANSDENSQQTEKKKRRKNKTGFPDPQEDPSLSDQASKALSYAFLQFRKPLKWKFNKARQNWLIRNFWSSDTIPDAYLDLVLQYLSNVKGGVREAILKASQTVLSPPVVEVKPSEPVAAETATTEQPPVNEVVDKAAAEKYEVKRARARALIDALESKPTS
ncbi:hypothetical protein C8J57DRAFT_1293942 [Mycena rebaudengoi]|nr:hypothetical protein C8J57DRAFT_1293942 [Mycena rebaudengoi]